MNVPIRTLIVDDEPLARQKLARFLSAEPAFACIGECTNGAEAIERIAVRDVDLVLLDVQMPGVSGLDVIEHFGPDAMPAVVFVTAFEKYAVDAFDAHAVDYLLKPFDRERFRKALERVRTRIAAPEPQAKTLRTILAALREVGAPPERFAVRKSDGIVLVPATAVEWIESQGNYVALHVGTASHLVRGTLEELEQRLDGRRFLRVRRTAIVNLDRVEALRPWTRDDHVVVLRGGARIPVSRRYKLRLEEALRHVARPREAER